ncbi:helix-turn-helix domain-containing protein [Plantactinospora soyae]|uniref:Transcriptional regulator with XRE-family HTH domain n=1 Tax=Plantactinospora soyae TaxID=1544732 RepID=A0A927M121_9ACTN|nr:helix-turn-helix transcriptional regulator [Plantactinospora soyae]MBE1486157.1 transcriptional regulator with XRE-family HTH domain [Plantactinospora soyae]
MIEFIIEEIRRARVTAGMTQDRFGRGANFSASQVSAVETGTRALTREYVRGADKALKTGGLFERMVIKLKLDGEPSWLREWIEIERKAESFRWFENTVIPALLQTEAYARAIFASTGVLTADEVTTRVAARLDRQAILNRGKPPQMTAVLDEGVLHRPIGGPDVMREQLRHLAKVAGDMPQVRLQVVPTGVGAYAGLSGPFVVAMLSADENLAFLDNYLQGMVVHNASEVAWIVKAWESIRSEALPHQQSTKLILEVAETWN